MAFTLVTHTVKKGENLTKIVKKYGHAGKDWKLIYKALYNAKFRKKRPDPNTILPGDEFLVPDMPRADLEAMIELLWRIEDWIKDAFKSDASVYAELKRLKKEKVKTAKAFKKAKGNLKRAQDWNKGADKFYDECVKTAKRHNDPAIGAIANCAVRAANSKFPDKEMKELERLYNEKSIDDDKIKKKIDAIEGALARRKKVMDMFLSVEKSVLDYLNKHYNYFFN